MAAKTVHLTIPVPCTQRWQDMKSVETGRFCAGCQKTVVDFSTLTDQQLISLLNQQKGPGCGRFRAGQLNRALSATPPVVRPPGRFVSLLAAGLLGFQTTWADVLPALPEPARHPTTELPAHPVSTGTGEQVRTDSVWVVTGRVIEQATNTGIPGASVTIKGTTSGANTDAEGHFEVRVPDELTSEQLILQITSIGYLTQEIHLRSGQLNAPLINLQEDSAALGEVITVGGYKRPSFFQRLWYRLRRGNH